MGWLKPSCLIEKFTLMAIAEKPRLLRVIIEIQKTRKCSELVPSVRKYGYQLFAADAAAIFVAFQYSRVDARY